MSSHVRSRIVKVDFHQSDIHHLIERRDTFASIKLGRGRQLRRRRSEEIRGRREYDGDEVEAVKLFLTGDDGVAAALGFEKLERERESGQAE